jgi:hypothetical protein
MPIGSLNKDALNNRRPGAGLYVISLCQLAAPVSIRPSQSPHLKAFTFFVGHTDLPDGRQQLSLQMGYFKTLADAQQCVQRVRGRYPGATVLPASAALPGPVAPAPTQHSTALLTDTQVMQILAVRGVDPSASEAREADNTQIPLIRPDDTVTRRALKAAVTVGAPVSFAVQLQSSEQPIDRSGLPSLALFNAHTTYVTHSRRDGRSRYFLRMGFFADPVSANQAACQVRAKFASAAVVPVTEQELMRAQEGGSQAFAVPDVGPPADYNPKPRAVISRKPPGEGSRAARPGKETLNQSLEQLAEREVWADPDTVSESGVRHLKIVVQRNSRS